MKKVVYTVTKVGRTENTKMSGLGYVTENDLIIACISKNQKPYIRVFEGAVKDCHKVINTPNEYKGAYYEVKEVEFETKNSSGQSTGFEKREIEMNYYIWYKELD